MMLLRRRHALAGLVFSYLCAAGAAPHNAGTTTPSPPPPPLAAQGPDQDSPSGRRLQGRFLHLTDLHPDPFYKTYSSTAQRAACHRKHGPAGVYGAETSGCDSPTALIDQVFAWISTHIKDDIDFVVWTGDSARHDNDDKIPRTPKQIIHQNEYIASKFVEAFGSNETDPRSDLTIPVVPNLGNNDIMPHNILTAGPNKWTLKYVDLWRKFIPEEQRHQFQQGGWFYAEVIPRKLAVISLNTMYFFSSNSGVDGCAKKHEPGYEHMEWLRIQLQSMRDRGMKAILIGHVPPARVDSKESWEETCWQKFALWKRQYRDIIVGSLFGHMNIDHFMLQDFKQLKKGTKKGRMRNKALTGKEESSDGEDGEISIASASDYLLDLRDVWANLPSPLSSRKVMASDSGHAGIDGEWTESTWQWVKSFFLKDKGVNGRTTKQKYLDKIGGKFAERYSVTHVSPSVVPNYFPTLRIFEYNITGLEGTRVPVTQNRPSFSHEPPGQLPMQYSDSFDYEAYIKDTNAAVGMKNKTDQRQASKKSKKWKFKVPDGPPRSAPPGPAYSPQPFTFTGYVQYFANLTHINNDFVGATSLIEEDASPRTAFDQELGQEIDSNRWKEGKHHKHQGKKPRPKPHPKTFKFEVEYDTKQDKGFHDLTVRRYVEYARRIGESEDSNSEYDSVDESETEQEVDLCDEFPNDDCEDDIEPSKKGKKHKHRRNSKAWLTFVKRAFVNTMDPHDIEKLFGGGVEDQENGDEDKDDSGMEL